MKPGDEKETKSKETELEVVDDAVTPKLSKKTVTTKVSSKKNKSETVSGGWTEV